MTKSKTFIYKGFQKRNNIKMRLSELKIGQKRIVESFEDSQMGGKLMTMGMIPGSLIEVVRKASQGKTFYIKVNGYGMALRANEASKILLKAAIR